MGSTKNFHEVSAIFFFILAFAYALGAMMFRGGMAAETVLLGMRLFDIPLALTGLLYGGTTLYLQMNEGEEETVNPWSIVIVAACILLFGTVVFINFAFPGQI